MMTDKEKIVDHMIEVLTGWFDFCLENNSDKTNAEFIDSTINGAKSISDDLHDFYTERCQNTSEPVNENDWINEIHERMKKQGISRLEIEANGSFSMDVGPR